MAPMNILDLLIEFEVHAAPTVSPQRAPAALREVPIPPTTATPEPPAETAGGRKSPRIRTQPPRHSTANWKFPGGLIAP